VVRLYRKKIVLAWAPGPIAILKVPPRFECSLQQPSASRGIELAATPLFNHY